MKIDPILVAQRKLLAQPFDIFHNIFHHYKVWENSKEIILAEKLEPNIVALDIACWWHDLYKGEENSESLIEALENTSVDSATLQLVEKIIEEHSFGEEQTSLESKILFDADKIEYISLARWQLAFNAFEKGLISNSEKERYIEAWNKRVPSLRGKLYFNYSNKEYERKFLLFVEWLNSIGRYKNDLFV